MAKHFQKGDRVFAKVRGYPPWPARIEEIEYNDSGRSKFLVTFYGTYETSLCKVDDLFHYSEYKEEYGKPMKRKGFNEALIQIDNDDPLPIRMPKNVKTGDNNQSSDKSINKRLGTKKVTFKRKRDSCIESPLKTSTTPNNQIELPPRKRFKVSPIGCPSNLLIKEVVSRSGRRIKPRKFSDDMFDDSTDLKCLSGIHSNAIHTEGTKVPKNYETSLSADRTLRKKLGNRNLMESETSSPKYLPKINGNSMDKNISSEYEQTQKVIKMDKSTWFRNEASLLELENTVRSHLTRNSTNTEKAIEALQQLNALSLHPLMLKKYPRIVRTMNRLRRYVGNVDTWKFPEDQRVEFGEEAKSIRSEAENVYKKFKALFTIPEGFQFSKVFQEEVSEFKKLILSLSHEEMCILTQDPMYEHGEIGIDTIDENSRKQITVEKSSLDDPYSQYIKQNISLCDIIEDPLSATYVDPKVDSNCEGTEVTHS